MTIVVNSTHHHLRPHPQLQEWSKHLQEQNQKFSHVVRKNKTIVAHLEGVPKFSLEDCQVAARQEDDVMYKKVRGLTQAQPRGLTFVECDGELVHVVRGLQKFSDFSDIKTLFHARAWEKATQLVFTEKANGENAKVAAMKLGGKLVWIIASKNVTMAVTDENFMKDLMHPFYDSTRFSFTRKIGEQWHRILQHLHPVNRDYMIEYLVTHKVTMIGEAFFKDSQHIVDMSDLDRKEAETGFVHRLQFFALADPRPEEMGLTHLPLIQSHDLLRSWELDVVPNVTVARINSPEQKEQEKSARERPNSEGAVVYALDDSDKCVCMYKWKNVQYVYWRAVRELMRAKAPLSRVRRRLSKEMYLPHPNPDAFIKEAIEFISWCRYEDEVRRTYDYALVFSTWYDRHNVFETLPEATKKQAVDWLTSKSTSTSDDHLQIAFVAIPGMGKSTLARALSTLLALPWINQDALGGKAQAYHEALAETANGKEKSGVICDKSHHKPEVRKALRDALKNIMQLVYVVIKHPDDAEDEMTNTVELAKQRIKDRGFGHRTLFKGSDLTDAMAMFKKDYKPLTQEEIDGASLVIKVDATWSLDQSLSHILYELEQASLLKRNKPTPEEVQSALEQSKEYELEMHKANLAKATTLYFSIQLDDQSEAKLQSATKDLLEARCPGMRIKGEHHVTLVFIKDHKPTGAAAALDSTLQQIEGHQTKFTASKLCFTNRVAALQVDPASLSVPHSENTMHLTLAQAVLKDGSVVPAVEAGLMFTKAHTSIDISPLELSGTIVRELKINPADVAKVAPRFGLYNRTIPTGKTTDKKEKSNPEKSKKPEKSATAATAGSAKDGKGKPEAKEKTTEKVKQAEGGKKGEGVNGKKKEGGEKPEKTENPEKTVEKKVEKTVEKTEKTGEMTEKPARKEVEKTEKPAEKTEKSAEKTKKPAEKTEKPAEKREKPVRKEIGKTEKPAEKEVEKTDKAEKDVEKQTEKAKKVVEKAGAKLDNPEIDGKPTEKPVLGKPDSVNGKPEKPKENGKKSEGKEEKPESAPASVKKVKGGKEEKKEEVKVEKETRKEIKVEGEKTAAVAGAPAKPKKVKTAGASANQEPPSAAGDEGKFEPHPEEEWGPVRTIPTAAPATTATVSHNPTLSGERAEKGKKPQFKKSPEGSVPSVSAPTPSPSTSTTAAAAAPAPAEISKPAQTEKTAKTTTGDEEKKQLNSKQGKRNTNDKPAPTPTPKPTPMPTPAISAHGNGKTAPHARVPPSPAPTPSTTTTTTATTVAAKPKQKSTPTPTTTTNAPSPATTTTTTKNKQGTPSVSSSSRSVPTVSPTPPTPTPTTTAPVETTHSANAKPAQREVKEQEEFVEVKTKKGAATSSYTSTQARDVGPKPVATTTTANGFASLMGVGNARDAPAPSKNKNKKKKKAETTNEGQVVAATVAKTESAPVAANPEGKTAVRGVEVKPETKANNNNNNNNRKEEGRKEEKRVEEKPAPTPSTTTTTTATATAVAATPKTPTQPIAVVAMSGEASANGTDGTVKKKKQKKKPAKSPIDNATETPAPTPVATNTPPTPVSAPIAVSPPTATTTTTTNNNNNTTTTTTTTTGSETVNGKTKSKNKKKKAKKSATSTTAAATAAAVPTPAPIEEPPMPVEEGWEKVETKGKRQQKRAEKQNTTTTEATPTTTTTTTPANPTEATIHPAHPTKLQTKSDKPHSPSPSTTTATTATPSPSTTRPTPPTKPVSTELPTPVIAPKSTTRAEPAKTKKAQPTTTATNNDNNKNERPTATPATSSKTPATATEISQSNGKGAAAASATTNKQQPTTSVNGNGASEIATKGGSMEQKTTKPPTGRGVREKRTRAPEEPKVAAVIKIDLDQSQEADRIAREAFDRMMGGSALKPNPASSSSTASSSKVSAPPAKVDGAFSKVNGEVSVETKQEEGETKVTTRPKRNRERRERGGTVNGTEETVRATSPVGGVGGS